MACLNLVAFCVVCRAKDRILDVFLGVEFESKMQEDQRKKVRDPLFIYFLIFKVIFFSIYGGR